MDNFTIRIKNPNAEYGGGGCLCSDEQPEDCKPPYVVWDAVDMASASNPYPVACQRCIGNALKQMEDAPAVDEKKRGTNDEGFVEIEDDDELII